MSRERVLYAVAGDTPSGKWKLIADIPEERIKAIQNGARHFSIYSFSDNPDTNCNIIRYGDLVVDFDCKESALEAVKSAQCFVLLLNSKFGVHPDELKYWLSGGKGCHIAIPDILYGGEDGDTLLPHIHRNMLQQLTENFTNLGKRFDLIDDQLYSMGKGHIIRIENQRRANGHYKVPLNSSEFMNLYEQAQIDMLTSRPANLQYSQSKTSRNKFFHEFYLQCLQNVKSIYAKSTKATECVDQRCAFMKYCKDNAYKLSYTAWFAMLSNFARLGAMGREMAHIYSNPHPKYNGNDLDDKLEEAKKINPYSCEKIKREIYNCGLSCKVKFPYLSFLDENNTKKYAGTFFAKEDGLYCTKMGSEFSAMKVCSPIEVIAYSHDTNGCGWGRIVRVTDPKGSNHTLVLPMAEIASSPENTIRKLMDLGLQFESYKKSKDLLLEYLHTVTPAEYGVAVKRCGWHGTVYVLKNSTIGTTNGELFVLDGVPEENLMRTSGTLEEWKEHVGSPCNGQALLQLAISFSFTGILLSPCNMEGGGLHFFGPSSCGKTTALIVAGSTYGGGPKGYVRQWRTTDNALESTASFHNDGFLCLDEIGQASSKVVSEVAYMLSNGQGRARANRDGNAKEIKNWTLSFMSTGELTLADCIALDVGKDAMAGQNVRILDIPADAGTGHGIFTFTPAMMTGSSFSQHLVRNAKTYYGTPALAFIEKFASTFDETVANVHRKVKSFTEHHCPEHASGQVIRGCQRFGLIAAAGELAITWDILPWKSGDAEAAAVLGFRKWVEQRGGIEDQELTNAITRLQEFIERNEHRFLSLETNNTLYAMHNIAGYTWFDGTCNERIFGIIPSVFRREICRTLNVNTMKKELGNRKWLALAKSGNPIDTKSVSGQTKRIIAVIPGRWQNISEDTQDTLELSNCSISYENIF